MGQDANTKDANSLSENDIFVSSPNDNQQGNVLIPTISSGAIKLCQIKPTDYDLFPIFKNYKEGKPGNKLYVKNLAKSVNVQDLLTLFGEFVISCKETANRENFSVRFFERGKLRRQAFVTYPTTFMAIEACRGTNGIMLKGKPILVVFAHGSNKLAKE